VQSAKLSKERKFKRLRSYIRYLLGSWNVVVYCDATILNMLSEVVEFGVDVLRARTDLR
jgi:hypothetical protein